MRQKKIRKKKKSADASFKSLCTNQPTFASRSANVQINLIVQKLWSSFLSTKFSTTFATIE